MNTQRIVAALAISFLLCTSSFAQGKLTGAFVPLEHGWQARVPNTPSETYETSDGEFCCDNGVFGFPDATCDGIPFDANGVDEIEINSFWIETVTADACADWTVSLTGGIKPPGPPIILFDDELSFGDLCEFVDLDLVFCAGYTTVLPDLTFSPPAEVPYSYGITTPGGSIPIPAVIENLSIE